MTTVALTRTPFEGYNVVNDIVITMYGARWALEIWGNTVHGMWLANPFAVHLKPRQNNIEGNLELKS